MTTKILKSVLLAGTTFALFSILLFASCRKVFNESTCECTYYVKDSTGNNATLQAVEVGKVNGTKKLKTKKCLENKVPGTEACYLK